MKNKLPNWIRNGFLLTLTSIIAGVLMFTPVLSQAIDTFFNINQRPVVSAASDAAVAAPLTDHPEGKLVNAIVADALGQSSNGDPLAALQGDVPDQELPVMTNGLGEAAFLPAEGAGNTLMDAQAELEGLDAVASVYVLPVADFRSDGIDPDGFFFSFGGGNISGKADATLNTCLMAPVYLPNGATILAIDATVRDFSNTMFIWLTLYRLDNYTGTVVEVAYMSTSVPFAGDSLINIYDEDITNPIVVYPDFSYYVGGCIPGPAINLYSVRIFYN